MTALDIINAIKTQKFTSEELSAMHEVLTTQRQSLSYSKIRELQVGQSVKFFHKARNIFYTGTIRKCKLKNVEIACSGPYGTQVWNVPASIVQVV